MSASMGWTSTALLQIWDSVCEELQLNIEKVKMELDNTHNKCIGSIREKECPALKGIIQTREILDYYRSLLIF